MSAGISEETLTERVLEPRLFRGRTLDGERVLVVHRTPTNDDWARANGTGCTHVVEYPLGQSWLGTIDAVPELPIGVLNAWDDHVDDRPDRTAPVTSADLVALAARIHTLAAMLQAEEDRAAG